MARRLIISIALISLFCAAARAEMLSTARGNFTVRYHGADQGKIDGVFATIDHAAQDIRDQLGISIRAPVEIVLARGTGEFEEFAGAAIPGWALAIARASGSAKGIVIDMSRTTPFLENNFFLILRHELIHIALAQVEMDAGSVFPLWFHEGTAIRISGCRHFTSRTAFRIAAAHGHQPALSDIAFSFPDGSRDAEIAYLASESFVDFLADRCREGGLAALIALFRESGDFESAVIGAALKPLSELEAEWREGLRSRFPWLYTFWRSLTLFTVISLMVIAVFIILFVRNRRKKLTWEEEEWLSGTDDADEDEEDEDDGFSELEDGPDFYEESLQ